MHARIFIGENNEELERVLLDIPGQKIEVEVQGVDGAAELRARAKYSHKEGMTFLIRNIDKASVEAQNALLKNIEEPSAGTSFVMTAKREDGVIETIKSRARVYYLSARGRDDREFAKDFFNKSVSAKLQITSKVKNREEAAEFLRRIISGGHALMLEELAYVKYVEQAERSLSAIVANGNVQMQLTSYVSRISV